MIILNTQAGCTPLYLASSKGHVAVVRLLVRRNADVNIRNKVLLLPSLLEDNLIFIEQENFSPVFVASQNGHTETVEVLVKAGAYMASTYTVKHLPTTTFTA